jgi:hypothetical protein
MLTRRTFPRKAPLSTLREHPKIHWPPGVEPNPPWAGPSREFPDPPHVILAGVELVEVDGPMPRHLALTGTYHSNTYHTTLTVDDPALLTNLLECLRKCVGEPVGEIGSHRVNDFLNLA